MERRSNERRTEEARLHSQALGLLHLIEHELRRGHPSVRVSRGPDGLLGVTSASPDERLRLAARDWLTSSGYRAVGLAATTDPQPVYVCVGTELAMRDVKPEDVITALRRSWEAMNEALEHVADPATRAKLHAASNAVAYWLPRLIK